MGVVSKRTVQQAVIDLVNALHREYGWFNAEELKRTPERIMRFLKEWEGAGNFCLTTFSNTGCDELVILKDISFYSVCSHHLLPFYGKMHIAYLPDKTICGVSKLARTVRKMASRPQVQESLTQEVAEFLYRTMAPKFVMVICEATHLCMLMRGVREHNSVMMTSAIRHPPSLDASSLKDEVLRLVRG